jgi:hypothetical protein
MLPLPSELTKAIDGLIDAKGHHLVSVAGAIQRARHTYPDLPASDEELTEYIAARAVHHGNAIVFDALERARSAEGR